MLKNHSRFLQNHSCRTPCMHRVHNMCQSDALTSTQRAITSWFKYWWCMSEYIFAHEFVCICAYCVRTLHNLISRCEQYHTTTRKYFQVITPLTSSTYSCGTRAISIPSFIMLGSVPATPLPVLSISIDGCPCVCPCYNSSIETSTLILAKKTGFFVGTRIFEIISCSRYIIYFVPVCRIKF